MLGQMGSPKPWPVHGTRMDHQCGLRLDAAVLITVGNVPTNHAEKADRCRRDGFDVTEKIVAAWMSWPGCRPPVVSPVVETFCLLMKTGASASFVKPPNVSPHQSALTSRSERQKERGPRSATRACQQWRNRSPAQEKLRGSHPGRVGGRGGDSWRFAP